MLLQGNAINGWMKSGLFLITFNPKVVFKTTMLYNVHPQHLTQTKCTAYACAIAIDLRVPQSMRLLEMRSLLTEKQLC